MALPDNEFTREEQYLAKIAGKDVPLPEKPFTRVEQYLAYIAGDNVGKPKKPFTRVEQYLDYIAENGGGSGGGDARLVNKSITQNGIYNPQDDGADGYRRVTVDVPNSYAASDEGKVVSGGELVSQTSQTVTENGVYDTTQVSQVTVDVPTYTLYGFHISGAESDPYAKVTYLEDAVGMTPAAMDYDHGVFDYGSWRDAFFMPRPCMVLQAGGVDYYLDPNDYSKKADGTPSDIADTSYSGNAMMEWGQNGKKIWYKVAPDPGDVTSGTVYISDMQIDSSYHAWNFINNQGKVVDHFYTPIYNGSSVNDGSTDVMRSMSGLAITQSLTGTVDRDRCLANNKGDDVLWYTEVMADRILINFLLILMGKSTDTQTVFGRGLDSGSQAALSAYRTGALDDKGLFFGYNDNPHGVKVFGMENWWGAQWRRIAGYILKDGDQRVKLTYGQQDGSTVNGYNDDGTGYLSMGITPTGTHGGYIDQMNFNEHGTFGKNSSGSSTTHFCDGQWFNNSGARYALFGGASAFGVACGAFCCGLYTAVSGAYWYVGVTLSYRPRE